MMRARVIIAATVALAMWLGFGAVGCGSTADTGQPAADQATRDAELAMREAFIKKLADEESSAGRFSTEKRIPPYPSKEFCKECLGFCGGDGPFCWCSCCTTC